MKPLIDGDVILYEIGFGAETAWKGMGHEDVPPFDLVEEMLEGRITHICQTVETETTFWCDAPIFFFTGKTNFRNEIARRKKYKDRPSNKPWHYRNIKAYIQGKYEWREQEPYEADDLLAIEQASRGYSDETIICSRDKDLRQVGGWSYSWELGQQAKFGPLFIEGYGSLEVSEDGKKVRGTGDKFFLFQCLTGDVVDNIPGLPKCGPVAALKILQATQTYDEGLEAVLEAYRAFYGGVIVGDEALTEQARLLHMLREKDKMWSLYA